MRRPPAALAVWTVLLLAVPPGIAADSEWRSDDRFQEFSAGKDGRKSFCSPSIFNLATGSDIRATSTCGRNGPEEYCKLTEHVYRRTPQCDTCDQEVFAKQHPIEYAIDGTRRWWQSPTLSNGLGYEKVNITIDLRQEYQVAYVIVKAGISPRPGTWVLEKSLDGVTYTPWQYYARSDPECTRVFGVPASVGVPKFTSDTEVICTSYYSRLDPMERGEIHTSLVNGRPSAEHPTEELQKFTTARFVRLRLISLRTMNADLMVINRRDEKLDHSVTRRYFYSISDISIGGQCICNVSITPTSCVYDEEVAAQQLSLTPEGKYEGGGRCVECRDNTVGINCERCADGFFRPVNVSQYSQDACRPCYCDAVGRRKQPCFCKEGFGGPRCDQCALGFVGYPKCEKSPFNLAGVRDPRCESEPGTIYLNEENPAGCQKCFCFGVSDQCAEHEWATGLITTNEGWNLTDFSTLLYYWLAPVDFRGDRLASYGSNIRYFVYYTPSSANYGHPTPVPDVVLEGNGLRLEYHSRINFFPPVDLMRVLADVSRLMIRARYHQDQTQSSVYGLRLEYAAERGAAANVDVSSTKLHPVEPGYRRVANQLYNGVCQKCECGGRSDNCDPFTGHCNNCTPCACPTVENSHSAHCALSRLLLEGGAAVDQDEYVCTACAEGYEGNKCEICADGFFGDAVNGNCTPCDCNGNIDPMEIGSCDRNTGECLKCTGGSAGEHCERCADNHWGSALQHDCRPCNCHHLGAVSAQCDNSTGLCTCVEGFTGPHCDRCLPGHGDVENSCPPCNCNPTGSLGESCDEQSGHQCLPGYFGFSEQGCSFCQCDQFGSIAGEICSNVTGECRCNENVEGTRCDTCAKGFFNITSGNGFTGRKCDKCAPNFWGLDEAGCKQCRVCPAPGHVCDAVTGECVCPPNTVGELCEACAPNAWNHDPLRGCELCNCDGVGAEDKNLPPDHRPVQMQAGIRRTSGQCKCRRLVTGLKCDECVNSFSLDANNPLGCTECFCFNRTDFCVQHNRVWSQLYTPDRRVRFDHPFEYFNRRYNLHILKASPLELQLFLGDRISSYGGHLRFKVVNDDNYRGVPNAPPDSNVFYTFPQILLVGNHRLELEHVPTEMYRNDEIALQELSLDVASEDTPGSSNSTALGIESCECPEGYTGASCQNPAEGYCRKRLPGLLERGGRDHTEGDSCERCKSGFYKDASGVCQKCACPNAENSFSQTCVPADNDRGYQCTACRAGTRGDFCEFCAPEFYGNPTVPGNFCQPCSCHHGALHNNCNNATGQCECREGMHGRDCSICSPRHAYMNGQCRSCDHGCHKDLMDLEDRMEQQLEEVKEIGQGPPVPRKRLARIQTTAQSLNELLTAITSSEGDAHQLLDNLDGGEQRPLKHADVVNQEFQLLDERNADSLDRVRDLKAEIAPIRESINAKNRLVSDTIAQLTHFSRDISGQTLSESEMAGLVNQANSHLEQKQHNYARKNAEDAETLLRDILGRKLNDTSYEALSAKERDYQARFKDARNKLWDEARPKIATARNLTAALNVRLATLQSTIDEIDRLNGELRGRVGNSTSDVEGMKASILDLHDHYQTIADQGLSDLRAQREELLKRKESINEIPIRDVQAAQEHARRLEHQAAHLKTLLSATQRLDAVAASTAYAEILGALKNASEAATKALESANEASGLVDAKSSGSLVSQTRATLNQSEQLQEQVLRAEGNDEYLVNTLASLQDLVGGLRRNLTDGHRHLEQIKESQQLLEDHNDRINTVYSSVNDAQSTVDDTENVITTFANEVGALNDRVQAVDVVNERNVQELIRNVTASVPVVDSVVGAIKDVKSRTARHDSQIRDIRKDLGVLREKIEEAREKAARIRIAIRSESDGGCVREYASRLHSSPSNTISLKYRPALDSPDSLLFLLKGKKVHVRWNIGAGRRDAAIMKRSLTYIPASDRTTWYQIDVTRTGNTIRLAVVQRRVAGGEARDIDEPTEIVVGEPDVHGDVVLNTAANQRVFVGHPSPQLAEELGLSTNEFRGTLGEMVLDATAFAQVRMATAERFKMISVTFSAYSKEGLLYFRGSPETRDFFALQLEDGAVGVHARINGQTPVHLRTNRTNYADGRSHRVRTIRKDGELHLQVDDEDHVSTVLPAESGEQHELQIANSDHFVGGLPSDYNRRPFVDDELRFDGFFGCISSVRPTQVSDLDLDHPVRSQRKEAGCSFAEERLTPNDRLIGFPQAGYLRTRGVELGPTSTFSFNLRTTKPNAMLLYQAGSLDARKRRQSEDGDSSFIAFYLFDGRLIAQLGTDAQTRLKRPSLSSEHTYNDGHQHSVFLARTPTEVVIRIDDREILSAKLEDEATAEADAQKLELGTSEPLIGCLSDFYLNYKRFPIVPEEHSATLGSCQAAVELPGSDDRTEAEEGEEQPALGLHHRLTLAVEEPLVSTSHSQRDHRGGNHRVRSTATCSARKGEKSEQTGSGARFGITSSSHSRLNFNAPYPNYNEFKVDFWLRTKHRNGLVWAWANYRNYTRYFFLTVDRGFLKLEVKGHREPKTLRYKHKRVDDDEWHHVELKKEGRNLFLQVDDFKRVVMREVPNPKVMKKRMFVGGVISKHRRQFKIPQGGFQGCLKDFKVDDVEQSLTTHSRDVVSCVQTSNIDYIHEGGFATFDPLAKWGTQQLDVSLNFKPATANRSVLLSAAKGEDVENTRLLVTIVDGGLVLDIHVDSYDVSVVRQLDFPVCANEWHRFSLKVAERAVELHLDEHVLKFGVNLGTAALNEILRQPFQLGASSTETLKKANGTSFNGCVRQLQLQNAVVPLAKARKLQKKKLEQGRRIPKEKAIPNPTAQEIFDILQHAGLKCELNKTTMHPRDPNREPIARGRVRVQLKNDDGSPVDAKFKTRKDLMFYVAEKIPQLKSRQPDAVAAAAVSAGPSQAANAGGKKKKR
ncbi:hypothetical protein M3Y99_00957600 [Aphelenchoides fujianensis]|nr:hypothetical protein M3Y99_00957600 [Aphelenchoides fujianensis]